MTEGIERFTAEDGVSAGVEETLEKTEDLLAFVGTGGFISGVNCWGIP
jgi:hypothetical protein